MTVRVGERIEIEVPWNSSNGAVTWIYATVVEVGDHTFVARSHQGEHVVAYDGGWRFTGRLR